MNKPVVTTSSTDHQIREIDDWWRENRDKSPDLFADDVQTRALERTDCGCPCLPDGERIVRGEEAG